MFFKGMPKRLMFIRHGESEANIIQKLRKNAESENIYVPEKYFKTPDREIRLSEEGVKQAVKTGEFLKNNLPNGVDVIYSSDHTRAKETCALVCLNAGWTNAKIIVDPQLGERNWGNFHLMDFNKRKEILELKKRDPLHTPMPDGETMIETRNRTRTFLDRCSRQFKNKTVLVFTHGEYIEAIWSEIAHMRTESQVEFFSSKDGDIKNCQIVEFKSKFGKFTEVRSSNPYYAFFGNWKKLEKKEFSPEELLKEVEINPSVFETYKIK